MSGHSKWSQIKRQKGATDQKRAALFTKLSNLITLAAKEGGGDEDTNFKLRLAVDKAKVANMPKDNIAKAIKRGTGELQGGQIEEINYEGFGPGGVAIFIEALTDNKNRTVSSIKHILNKYGGNLGSPGSVAWMFERKGVLRISQEKIRSREDLELKAIDAGAEDLKMEDDGLMIYTVPENLAEVQKKLQQAGVEIEYAEIEFIPKETVSSEEEIKSKLEKLYEELDNDPDVNNYYTNEA